MNKLLRLFSVLLSAGGALWCVYVLWQYNISAVVAAVATVVTIVAFALTWVKTEIAAGTAFAASVAWILESAELIEYKLIFPHLQIPVAFAAALLVVAAVLLFVSAQCWQHENGKRFRPALVSLLLVVLLTMPTTTFLYKTTDVNRLNVVLSQSNGGQWQMRISDGKKSATVQHPVLTNDETSLQNIVLGLKRMGKRSWQSGNCKVRLYFKIGKLKYFTLVRNNETGDYFEENEICFTPERGVGNSIFDINERMLHW